MQQGFHITSDIQLYARNRADCNDTICFPAAGQVQAALGQAAFRPCLAGVGFLPLGMEKRTQSV